MKLADWLALQAMNQQTFAALLGTSQGYVSELCSGKRWPGRDMMMKIQAVTHCEVRPQDFLAEPGGAEIRKLANGGEG